MHADGPHSGCALGLIPLRLERWSVNQIPGHIRVERPEFRLPIPEGTMILLGAWLTLGVNVALHVLHRSG